MGLAQLPSWRGSRQTGLAGNKLENWLLAYHPGGRRIRVPRRRNPSPWFGLSRRFWQPFILPLTIQRLRWPRPWKLVHTGVITPPLFLAPRGTSRTSGLHFHFSHASVRFENQILMDAAAALLFQAAADIPQLPCADRRVGRVAVWNRKVPIQLGIVEIKVRQKKSWVDSGSGSLASE